MGAKLFTPLLNSITATTGMKLTATGITMFNAGFTAVCSQATTSFLKTGDLSQVGKDLASVNGLRSLGISVLSAGLCEHIGTTLGVEMNPGLSALLDPQKQLCFMDFLKANALKIVIDTPLQCVIGGSSVEDAVTSGLKNLGVNTVASYCAYHIGAMYGIDKLNYFEHKAMHGGVGAIAGWLLNPTRAGLIGGAVGAVTAEVVMDARREIALEKVAHIITEAEQDGIALDDFLFKKKLYEALSGEVAFAKLSGATVAAFLGQDPSIAFQTAGNAAENNGLILAVSAGFAAYEVYKICKILQHEGPAAALKHVGIELTMAATAAGTGYVVGKVLYPTAELAWAAYLAANPAFKQVIDKAIKPLQHGAEKVAAKANDFIHKAEDTIGNAWTKGKEKFGFGQAGRVKTWEMPPLKRGIYIEEVLAATEYKNWYHIGKEKNGFFPLIDFQEDLFLVSLKSVDTRGKTWIKRMESHIKDLSRRRGTVGGKPAQMVLDLRVQPGGLEHAKVLEKAAEEWNVILKIKEFH